MLDVRKVGGALSVVAMAALLSACGGGSSQPEVVAGPDALTVELGKSAHLLGNDSVGGASAQATAGGNVSFALKDGQLPAGISVEAGQLTVAASAVPGVHKFSYKICESGNASNCASADVTLTVPPPPIVATADALTLGAGGTADVLLNDTLGTAAAAASTVTASLKSGLPTGVEFNEAGLLTVGTAAIPGVYELSYGICQKIAPSNCASSSIKLTVQAQGTLSGSAIDAATGLGVHGITVRVAGLSTTTDAAGNFSLAGVSVQDRVPVIFDGATHAETVRIASVKANTTTDVRARLLKVGGSSTVDITLGGSATLSASPAAVFLPPNAVQRADGSVPVGNMTVELTAIDPAVDSSVMPGDFTTLVGDVPTPIESFGAINVRLKDSEGKDLNLRAGQTATIRIPVATRSPVVQPQIPLFFFNTATGRWVQEGTANLSSDRRYYEGTVTHFTIWNADQVYDTVRVLGCVMDALGARVPGALVQSDGVDYSGFSSAVSDANGKFSLPIRKGSMATVVGLAGGKLTNTLRYGPLSSDYEPAECLSLGQTGAGVTMKLTWGARPWDLDSHLYTPSGEEVYFGNKGQLTRAPFANLDVDDTSSYGPEVVTITKLMVGTYKYWVHNYSGSYSGSFASSNARVELNIPGRAAELFVPPTSGETSSTDWWQLFEFDVSANCTVTLRRQGSFALTDPRLSSSTPQYCTP